MTTRMFAFSAAVLGLALGSVPAFAQFSVIAQPDAAYLSATSRLDVTAPDFDIVSSLSDSLQTVSFSSDLVALTVPATWSSWGAPPATEEAAPRVLATQGDVSLTLSLAAPSSFFGFEAQPNDPSLQPMTATFFDASGVVGEVILDVDGAGGALLFAAQNATPFTSVTLSSTGDFAIAQIRYGAAVPEPGVVALSVAFGLSGLAALRRTRRNA